jgi:CheY-like chemotaxis protein
MPSAARILVVDDDNDIVLFVSSILRKQGYEVAAATDGWDALSRTRSHRPQLILLDVVMPQMDGWTFLGFLRSQKDFSAVPVIFLTGRGAEGDRKKGMDMGALDYLVKPVDAQLLLERVAKALARPPAPEPAPAPAAATRSKFGLRGRLDQLNLAALVAILGAGKRTGTLDITQGPGGRTAKLLLQDGRVAAASTSGPDPASGLAALQAVGSWGEGDFAFASGEVRIPEGAAEAVPPA